MHCLNFVLNTESLTVLKQLAKLWQFDTMCICCVFKLPSFPSPPYLWFRFSALFFYNLDLFFNALDLAYKL